MSLKLTNTLTRKKEPFLPIIQGQASIYCCGVTVYDLCHLGHARSYIVWDVLRRYLIWLGYKVIFVQNFTDIDDKILNRASLEGCSMEEISERNIQAFYEDMDALGILRADRMPRATKCLDGIRTLIKELERSGKNLKSVLQSGGFTTDPPFRRFLNFRRGGICTKSRTERRLRRAFVHQHIY